ncbi:MAG: hypothetical protein ACR2KB_05015 [Chitinophagaceae bacterium]
MANKENKGGVLTNDQIEQDLKVGGKDHQQEHYHGTKDPGVNKPQNLRTSKQTKEQDKEDDKK